MILKELEKMAQKYGLRFREEMSMPGTYVIYFPDSSIFGAIVRYDRDNERLSYSEFNPKLSETEKACVFYHDTDHEIEDRSIIYKDMGIYCTPEYNYYIKISSKETIDNITEYDYNEMIMDFEHKIKQYKIKNKIDSLSKDFE